MRILQGMVKEWKKNREGTTDKHQSTDRTNGESIQRKNLLNKVSDVYTLVLRQ